MPKQSRATTQPRVGQGDVELSREEFERRLGERFYDPAFRDVQAEIDRIVEVAWEAYDEDRKRPLKREAGKGFDDPGFELPVEWLATRRAIRAAERRQRARRRARRVLLISGASRTSRRAPARCRRRGASSRSRAGRCARAVRVRRARPQPADEQYGKQIHPCKACVSTAMPLCHWPCSCYPNHAMGQVDRLDERDLPAVGRRPRRDDRDAGLLVPGAERAEADDRPARLRRRREPRSDLDAGKDPCWPRRSSSPAGTYPKHLAGRAFSVVVHGDAAGAETLRRPLRLAEDMHLVQAVRRDDRPLRRLLRAVRQQSPGAGRRQGRAAGGAEAARILVAAIREYRSGRLPDPERANREPRPK